MNSVLEILQSIHPDVDFATETALIDDGVLDSLDIITLISEISNSLDVDIPVEEIVPENFNSCQALEALINRLED